MNPEAIVIAPLELVMVTLAPAVSVAGVRPLVDELPIRSWPSVKVVWPVPPLATGTVPRDNMLPTRESGEVTDKPALEARRMFVPVDQINVLARLVAVTVSNPPPPLPINPGFVDDKPINGAEQVTCNDCGAILHAANERAKCLCDNCDREE